MRAPTFPHHALLVRPHKGLLWRSCALGLAATLALGCAGDKPSKDNVDDFPGPEFLDGPTIGPAQQRAPLSFVLSLQTDTDASVTADLLEEDGTLTVVNYTQSGTDFELPLLGFKGNAVTQVTVHITDAQGTTTAAPIAVEPTLPNEWPDIEAVVSQPDKMEPGYRLFSVRPALFVNDNEFLMVADERGEIVWTLVPDEVILDIKPFQNGNLLAVQEADDMVGGPVVEYTLLGDETSRWKSNAHAREGVIVDGIEGFHHDVIALDNGDFMGLSKEPFFIENYHMSYVDRPVVAPQTVSADIIVSFTPSGEVLDTWRLSELLDPQRIGYDAIDVTHSDGLYDWTHANAIMLDPADGNLVVSVRNQDAIIKIDVDTHELIWILATPDNWNAEWMEFLLTPRGDLEWSFHQHGHDISEDNRILVFDNGLQRASPFVDDPLPVSSRYSRVVEYEIFPDTLEVAQTWEFKDAGDGILFSDLVGNARYLQQSGNVLGCFGYITSIGSVSMSTLGLGKKAIRIIEFSPGDPHEVVFDLKITSDGGENSDGWVAYRAEYLESLYTPDVATVTRMFAAP